MNTTEHTPGPWTVGPHQNIISRGWPIRIEDGSTIGCALGDKNPEMQMNARLISAAPDLLSALIECVDYLAEFFEEGRDHRVVKKADAAIAKATGEAT